MFIFLKTTIPSTCSGSAPPNYFNNFIKNTINYSGSTISLKIFIFLKNNLIQDTSREAPLQIILIILLKTRSTAREAPLQIILIIFKNNHSKKLLGKRGSRVHPAALICPNDTRGKDPWSFSPRGSPFSLRNHRRTKKTHAIRNDKRRRKHRFH